MRLLITALACLISVSVLSQTTFTGAIDNNWSNAGNWDNGLPTAGNDATIPDGAFVLAVSLTVNFTLNNYGTINNGGTINNDGTINNYAGTIYNDGDISNSGDIYNYEGIIYNDGSIDNDGVISNSGDIYNDGSIDNDGTIYNNINGIVNNDGTIYNHGAIDQCGTWNGANSSPNPYTTANCSGSIVEELEALSVLIYPNPSSNNLTIDLGDLTGLNTTIKLYDSSSKLIFEKRSTSTLRIDLSGYAKGLYTLELSNSDKVLRSQVVIE